MRPTEMSTHNTTSTARTTHPPRRTSRRLRDRAASAHRSALAASHYFGRQVRKANRPMAIAAPATVRSSRWPATARGPAIGDARPRSITPDETPRSSSQAGPLGPINCPHRAAARTALASAVRTCDLPNPATRLHRDSVPTRARALRNAGSQPDPSTSISTRWHSPEDSPLRTDAAVIVDARGRSQPEQKKRWAARVAQPGPIQAPHSRQPRHVRNRRDPSALRSAQPEPARQCFYETGTVRRSGHRQPAAYAERSGAHDERDLRARPAAPTRRAPPSASAPLAEAATTPQRTRPVTRTAGRCGRRQHQQRQPPHCPSTP